jgi:predicted DNA-binding transcriptional regulator AlpA
MQAKKSVVPSVVRVGIAPIKARTGASDATIWRWCRDGKFPLPEYLGERRVWRLDVIEKWEAERIARPRAARRSITNITPVAAP